MSKKDKNCNLIQFYTLNYVLTNKTTKMKKIFLIAIILIGFACKKKTVTPEPVTPPCITSPDQFTGKYLSADGDTVMITFLHNNCPTDKSNTYTVKGIGLVANKMLKNGETFENKDYEVVADEKISKAVNGNYFSLVRQSNAHLIFNSYKINSGAELTKI